MSAVGAEQRLPPEVHQARRAATITGCLHGWSQARIAASLGMTAAGYARWLGRHARDLAGVAGVAREAEEPRRRAAVLAGDAAGRSRASVAAELGLHPRTLSSWARRHVGPPPRRSGRPEPAPKPPPTEPLDMSVRVGWTRHGWTIGCPRCQRWFVRPSRRAADKFAALHARCCSGGRE